MVDLGTALSEQLLDVAVGEAEAEVPADRQHDYVRWEPEASEGRPRDCTRTNATGSHADSLAAQRSHSERNSAPPSRQRTAPTERSADYLAGDRRRLVAQGWMGHPGWRSGSRAGAPPAR